MPESVHSSRDVWIERAVALLAFGALMLVILGPSRPREWPEALGDFKLVYASAAGLGHGADAYSFDHMLQVFDANGVVHPPAFGHAPVYPPFTLFVVSPLLLLPLIPAAYLWALLSYLAVGGAAVRLARYADRIYRLPLGFRIALIVLMAASPLINFGLELANLSVFAACLCLYAATVPPERSNWWHAFALAWALLLKPHLAFWIFTGLVLLTPNTTERGASSAERKLALRAAGITAVLLLMMALYLAVREQLPLLIHGYVDVLQSEAAGGSMDPRAHQIIIAPAQITSLASLLGYWVPSTHTIAMVQLLILPPLGFSLLWVTLRVAAEHKAIVLSAWIAFGLIVTYHRAHDATILFLMLPFVMARLRRRWYDPIAWLIGGLYAAVSVDLPPEFFRALSSLPLLHGAANLLLYRQVAFATALLAFTLLFILLRCSFAGDLREAPLTEGQFLEA